MIASRGRRALDRLAESPWLIGDPDVPGARLRRRARRLSVAAIVAANVGGAAVVVCFAVWALPKPSGAMDGDAVLVNVVAACVYTVLAVLVGVRWARRRLERGPAGLERWLEQDRPPTPAQQLRVLRAPLRIMGVQAVLWGVAVVGFTLLNLRTSGLLALGIGLTVALGGLTTSAIGYLLGELALRPIASRALLHGPPRARREGGTGRLGIPGVGTRSLMTWALGTGVPIFGLLLVGVVALTPVEMSRTALAVTVVALCAIGLVFGAFASTLAAYATVHPISSIRSGLERVRAGDLDVRIGVWDSTEMGLLQAGFNDMADGLRERERIHDLFGRHVGHDVARQALADEAGLGGEVVEDVAVLFVDVVGSTTLAARHPPQHVVGLLNRFFGVVVDVVEEHGGWINKFQGDGALAIFGAPAPLEAPERAALRAARALDARLRREVPELRASVGVAVGPVVAGHIGAERRYEYTVIGDPVNQAARLTELAKRTDGRILTTTTVTDRAGDEEAGHWRAGDEVVLRGREEPTRLAAPA